MKDLDKTFGANVTRLRERRKLSQAEVATRMKSAGYEKWSQSTVWSVEKGERPLRFSEAHDLARVLGATIDSMTLDPAKFEIQAQIDKAQSLSTDITNAYRDLFSAQMSLASLADERGDPSDLLRGVVLAPSNALDLRAFEKTVWRTHIKDRVLKSEPRGKLEIELLERWRVIYGEHPEAP